MISHLPPTEGFNAMVLLETMNDPFLCMGHWSELVSELSQTFCRGEEALENLFVHLETDRSSNVFCDGFGQAPRIGTAMWGPEEYDPHC